MKTVLTRVCCYYEGRGSVTMVFCHKPDLNVEMAMRQVVRDFLETPAGKEVVNENHGDFNWGDAKVQVPTALWLRYGLKYVREPCDASFSLDHDENLAGE